MNFRIVKRPYLYSQIRTAFPSVIPAVYSDTLKNLKDDLQRVFIQNIPLGTTSDELYEFLDGFGYAQKCEIAFNKTTREPKLFGFASIDKNAAEYLINNINRIPFKGTILSIRHDAEANPAKKWEGIPEYKPTSNLPKDKFAWKSRARSWEETFNKKKK